MRRNVPATLVLMFCLIASGASACLSTPEERRAEFDKLDTEKDGFLSVDEFFANDMTAERIPHDQLQDRFDAHDTDGDGRMSFEEYEAQRPKQRC
jgi:Ca2+-binding EF-hand superfamily protein